jgi:hypothetical protein
LGYKEETGNVPEITELVSNEGEVFTLQKAVKTKVADKGVEAWLKVLESEMVSTVHKRVKECFKLIQKEVSAKKEWVLKHACQVVSVVCMLIWTEQIEESILYLEDNPFAMQEQVKT